MVRTPRYLIVVAAGLLALVPLALSLRPDPPRFGQVYAVDTVTGELFASSEGLPPLTAPSGPGNGVLAQVVRFEGASEPTVIYVRTYSPAARAAVLAGAQVTPEVLAGTLVRRPDDREWVPIGTPAGQAIVGRTAEVAAGRTWRLALPDKP